MSTSLFSREPDRWRPAEWRAVDKTDRAFRTCPRTEATFAAQVIGQDHERRGLRAGPLYVNRAREAYRAIASITGHNSAAHAGRTL